MKRLTMTLLLLIALDCAIVLLCKPATPVWAVGCTIEVNGVSDVVEPGERLTLREAMRLATGRYSVHLLSQSECWQLSCAAWVPDPLDWCNAVHYGEGYADTIVFDSSVFPLGSPQTIDLDSSLPFLDTGHDTVDGSGAGVIIDGGTGMTQCFVIYEADGHTIKGLEINSCWDSVYITQSQDNTVGGDTPEERNVITNSFQSGVLIRGAAAVNNVVKGNYIGTDSSGTSRGGRMCFRL